MVVYLDIYFVINFLADAILLKAVQKSTSQMRKNRWILLGAAVGGVGACCLLFCHGHQILEMTGCLALAVMMCWASFGKKKKKLFVRELLLLYGYGMLLGGVMSAISMRWPVSGVLEEAARRRAGYLPAAVWLAAVMGCYGLLRLFMRLYGEYRSRPRVLGVTIAWSDRRWSLTGIVDTGNTLRDPRNGKPVIVVQKSALAAENFDSLLAEAQDTAAAGVCLIPFQAVGKTSGVMLGFKPDYVEVGDERVEAVVALTDQVLDADGGYQALLHPELAMASGG